MSRRSVTLVVIQHPDPRTFAYLWSKRGAFTRISESKSLAARGSEAGPDQLRETRWLFTIDPGFETPGTESREPPALQVTRPPPAHPSTVLSRRNQTPHTDPHRHVLSTDCVPETLLEIQEGLWDKTEMERLLVLWQQRLCTCSPSCVGRLPGGQRRAPPEAPVPGYFPEASAHR